MQMVLVKVTLVLLLTTVTNSTPAETESQAFALCVSRTGQNSAETASLHGKIIWH